MKLKFLRTPANLPTFREGTVHDVADEPAKKFIQAGIAVIAGGPDDVTTADGVEPTDEEVEAAANRVEFTQAGNDSKANRPPPVSEPVKTDAKAGPQRSQRSQPQQPPKPADKK